MDALPPAHAQPRQAHAGVSEPAAPHLPSDHYRRIVEVALERTVNGVVITDARLAGNPIVHVNQGFTRITGYAAHEALGRSCSFLQGPERQQKAIDTLREAIALQRPVTVLLRNFRKDGSLFWNQVEMSPVEDPETGEVTHFFALQTDMTLQKQAQDASMLRTLELEKVFNSHPLGMVSVDAAGRIRLLSPAFMRLFEGVREHDLVGQALESLTRQVAALSGTDPARMPWPSGVGQTVHWSLAGQPPRTIELTRSLVEGAQEQMVLFRDVTDERSQQNSRTEFIATAAHELRTPMGSICGFTELLLMRNYSRDEARPLLETVMSQSLRLSAMLNDLLDLSHMDAMGEQSFAVRPIELASVMRRAAQVVVLPGSGRNVAVSPSPEGLRVQGHSAKLEQVLINLLSNALKYSPGGGEVSMVAREGSQPGWWEVAVTDHGLGLSPEHQAKLFTRFFRADPGGAIPGTGLGLVIAKELIDRMGGRIEVHSQLGVGTTFTLHLQHPDAPSGPAEKGTP